MFIGLVFSYLYISICWPLSLLIVVERALDFFFVGGLELVGVLDGR